MTEDRAKLYNTAIATIGCAKFQAGDHVAIRFDRIASNGVLWFNVAREPGNPDAWTVYPEHHLSHFVF